MPRMEVQGHFHNGMIVPNNGLTLPDGTEVTITVRTEENPNAGPAMTDEERNRYLAALARLDTVENENPGDAFSGADHDRELYGTGS